MTDVFEITSADGAQVDSCLQQVPSVAARTTASLLFLWQSGSRELLWEAWSLGCTGTCVGEREGTGSFCGYSSLSLPTHSLPLSLTFPVKTPSLPVPSPTLSP